MSRTAVIAGQGGLAPAVIAALDDPLVYALDGFAPPVPATPFRLERLVPFLDRLIEHGVDRVIFAGAVRRPRLDPEATTRRISSMSKPQWRQKFASSAATTARRIWGDTSPRSTQTRGVIGRLRASPTMVRVVGGLMKA